MTLQNLRVEDKTIRYEAIKPFDTILNFNDHQSVLDKRSFNITGQLARVFKVFEDFRFINQLRNKIDKIKLATTTVYYNK